MVNLKKWQWVVASLLFLLIVISDKFGDISVKRTVNQIVYSSEDLIVMRSVLSDFVFRDDKKISVSADTSIEQLLTYATIERYNKGVLLSFEQGIVLNALYEGLVVFTGHTKYNGKTLSILYENGLTVTLGYVDQFYVLPYTAVAKGTLLASKGKGKLYLQIEDNGNYFNLEQTTKWLKEQHIQ